MAMLKGFDSPLDVERFERWIWWMVKTFQWKANEKTVKGVLSGALKVREDLEGDSRRFKGDCGLRRFEGDGQFGKCDQLAKKDLQQFANFAVIVAARD